MTNDTKCKLAIVLAPVLSPLSPVEIWRMVFQESSVLETILWVVFLVLVFANVLAWPLVGWFLATHPLRSRSWDEPTR